MDAAHDEALLDDLRAASARLDPVPDTLLEAGRAAYAWRTLDADIAALTYDSLLEDKELAGVRGAPGPRLLSFEAGDVVVECEVHEQGRGRRLVGQIAAPDLGALTIRHGLGEIDAVADDLGRFLVDAVPAGPVSLRVELGDRAITTDWVAL